MRPYVIRQGDYLPQLAARLGFDAAEIWNHNQNRELRDRRGSGDVLAPGDVLHVPRAEPRPLPLSSGSNNRFRAEVTKVPVSLVFEEDGEPLANAPYTIEGLGSPREGTTDGQGNVAIEVPLHVRELRVVFTEHEVAYPVLLGNMDPIETPSGVRKRLEHLGYRPTLEGVIPGVDDEVRDRHALLAFQEARRITATGVADRATLDALLEAHGS